MVWNLRESPRRYELAPFVQANDTVPLSLVSVPVQRHVCMKKEASGTWAHSNPPDQTLRPLE